MTRQKAWVLHELPKLSVRIHRVWRDVGPGWTDPRSRSTVERSILRAAADDAREQNAVLVAASVDRLVRKYGYHPDRIDDGWPTTLDFEMLRKQTRGVTLATIVPPDTPLREVRGIEAKRGMQATGNMGGRPRKRGRPRQDDPRRKGRWLSRVLELQAGGSPRREIAQQIAREAGVTLKTVYLWCREAMEDTGGGL